MKAATREEAAKWVEVLNVLQAMDTDDSNSSTNRAEDDPNASIVRDAEGARGVSSASQWRKDSGCMGLLRMCGCWRAD